MTTTLRFKQADDIMFDLRTIPKYYGLCNLGSFAVFGQSQKWKGGTLMDVRVYGRVRGIRTSKNGLKKAMNC